MGRFLMPLCLALCGCSALQDFVESTKEVAVEQGPQVVEKVGEAAGGSPVAIVAAIGAVATAVTAVVVKMARKRGKTT